jgi:hypothetical protein
VSCTDSLVAAAAPSDSSNPDDGAVILAGWSSVACKPELGWLAVSRGADGARLGASDGLSLAVFNEPDFWILDSFELVWKGSTSTCVEVGDDFVLWEREVSECSVLVLSI